MDAVTVLAPGKVNLTLRVLGRRVDGLHEVRTLLCALDHGDRLRVERLGGRGLEVELSVTGEARTADVPLDGTNLAARGARLALEVARARGLAGASRARLGVSVEKLLPSRAGLGGGSSDAAAAALGAARVLGLDPDDAEVEALLAGGLAVLGTDVPFFFAARDTGLAWAEGRGERLTPLPPLGPLAFAVLTPAVACPTAAVYAALAAPELDETAILAAGAGLAEAATHVLRGGGLEEARAVLANDLEPAALAAFPELARVRADLDAAGAEHFRLAGSGSSFFGLFAQAEQAERFLAGRGVARIARDHGLRAHFVARAAGHGARLLER